MEGVVSEIMLVDYLHEGIRGGFDENILRCFPEIGIKILLFGGLHYHFNLNNFLEDNRFRHLHRKFSQFSEHALQKMKGLLINGVLKVYFQKRQRFFVRIYLLKRYCYGTKF